MEKLKNLNWLKIVKIALGAVIAASIAYALELQYAVSAGVIALLTIQDTRRETLNITLKRVIAFVLATVLSCAVFSLAGFSLPALGIVLAVFLFLCFYFDMNEAIAMNSVIATHYFASGDCSQAMIMNEVLLLAAGAGTGVLLNIFIPVNIAKIRRIQSETDSRIKRILSRMSVYILAEDKSDYTGSCFDETNRLLDMLRRESVQYLGNSFCGERDYFLKYAGMRMKQCDVLGRIYTDIMRLSDVRRFGEPISEFLDNMSCEFHEINDAAGLLRDIDGLFSKYSEETLPESRSEFENRALMYHILWDLKYFVSLKADFAAGLSENEKRRYWYKSAKL